MKRLNNKKGISLIVLVITIIVMIILATAIILSLNSSNIVGKANEAQNASDAANIKHAASVAYAEYTLGVSEGKIDGTTVTAEAYVKEELKEQGISEKQIELIKITETGKVIVYKEPKVPEGFTLSIYEGEKTVDEGMVIYETESLEGVAQETAMTTYNQYVWVPVPETSEFVRRDGYNSGKLQTYVSGGSATEPFSKGTLSETNDLTGEYAEYAKMKESVEKNGGFYIARYEAGDGTATAARTALTNEVTDKRTVVSKKDAYVYNYVPWGESMISIAQFTKNSVDNVAGAVELARSIYPESSDKEVVSTLIYGVQWDAVMNFMKDVKNPDGTKSEYYIYDSINMGWYSNNNSGNASHKTGIDVDENSSNMVKNIYDMAGNVDEWTMEACDTNARVIRGGYYSSGGSNSPASKRGHDDSSDAYNRYGFRLTLYIK